MGEGNRTGVLCKSSVIDRLPPELSPQPENCLNYLSLLLLCVFGGCTRATASVWKSEDSWHLLTQAPLLLEAAERGQASTVNSRCALQWLCSGGRDSLKEKKKSMSSRDK